MRKMALAVGLLVLLAGCGKSPPEGWRGLSWWAPSGESMATLNEIRPRYRKVDSVPPPAKFENSAEEMMHYLAHPKIEDKTLPPAGAQGWIRAGACVYTVTMDFDSDGGLSEVSERSSIMCLDDAKERLEKTYGKPSFSEIYTLEECRTGASRGVQEVIAWTTKETRVEFKRGCMNDSFSVNYWPIRY